MDKLNIMANRYGYLVYIVLIISMVSVSYSIYSRYFNFIPKAVVLDIGQGSSNLLDLSPKDIVIIDGGPDNSLIRKIGKYLPFWKRDISALVVTNADKDHYFGFIDLCGRYDVGLLVIPPKSDNKESFNDMISCFRRTGTGIVHGYLGKSLRFDDFSLDILFPDRQMNGYKVNDSSLILRLSKDSVSDFRKNIITFMGDSPKKIERYLSKILDYVKTEYIVVGHHGSKTSSDKKWIKEFGGGMAIISAGKNNRYGHPNKETLDVLKDNNVKILNTAERGDIVINI